MDFHYLALIHLILYGNMYVVLYLVINMMNYNILFLFHNGENGGNEVENKQNILKPDILRIYNDSLIIFDSKYYNIELTNDTVKNNPGIYDILKQYAYELAF